MPNSITSVSKLLSIPLVALLAASVSAQTIGLNFTGVKLSDLAGLNSGYSYIPPDTMGAIGPSHFVAFTNGTFSVYDKTTGGLVGSRTSLTNFYINAGVTGLNNSPTAGTGTSDPHVLYNPNTGRWYAVAIDTPSGGLSTNRYLIAVSNSSDPTAGWKAFSVTNPSSPGVFADYPMVGIDSNNLYVSTNNFTTANAGVSTGVVVVPLASLNAGNITGVQTIANISPGTTGYSPQPIVDYTGTGTTHNMLSAYNSTNLALSTITNTTTTPAMGSTTFLTVTNDANTQTAKQPGGPNTIDSGDERFAGSVIKVGNFIWGVNTITISGHEALQWYRLNALTNTLAESGVLSDAARDLYYGSIMVNSAGNIVVGYTESGTDLVPSAYASTGFFNGTSTSWNASPLLLKAGTGNYNVTYGGNSNRWGDFSQTTLDPNNSLSFWTVQEYVDSANIWGTQITQISFQGPAVTTPEPGAVATFAALSLCGGMFAIRRRRRR